MRKWADQALFVVTCLVSALFMGGGWGALVYQFDREVGWWVGVVFGVFVFVLLIAIGWNPHGDFGAKPHRRFDD